ncbi:MAG: 2-iminobutanoate/2-iminopropanoate deaminase [Acidimicrobiaceae bacterium]|jgi:reactive intermediate/imine deaminase|nr:2-iminobutanoate/2-iminopropanoate deaminase [Acidimicrobiaceae bacterium]
MSDSQQERQQGQQGADGRRPVSTTEAAAPAGPYSQGVVFNGVLYLAGQGPVTPDGRLLTGAFAEQAHQVFRNLTAVAKAAGGDLRRAVRVGVFLTDLSDFAEMNEIYREYFSEPFPVRTTIQSNLPGFAIEVDAIVAMDADGPAES